MKNDKEKVTPQHHSEFEIEVKLEKIFSSDELISMVRGTKLLGDPAILPYINAQILIKSINISNLSPAAYYVLESQIQQHKKFHQTLKNQSEMDIFGLNGIIQYQQNREKFRMAPPIVETYFENSNQSQTSTIVDGLHRVWLAKQLGYKKISVVEISNFPFNKYPLIPLPLQWSDVRMVKTVPESTGKLRYRFPNVQDFPETSFISEIPIDENNFRFFFYRDFSHLGSSGIRKSDNR